MSRLQRLGHWLATCPLLPRQRGYNAAQPGRLDGAIPARQAVNHLIAAASPRLRGQVRDLVRNFPLFTRGLNAYTAFVVGRGARFQSMAVLPDGSPDHAVRRMIERRFRLWMAEEADISGTMHFYELQQLLCRMLLESGEGFFHFGLRKNWRINPLALLPLEGDRLTDVGAHSKKEESRIFNGVEYLASTGERLAYHVADEGYGRVRRVPAADMLHIFQTLRPGQLRGVTPFAPAILFARAMADYTQSELDTVKMASKYMAFVSTDTPDEFQAARGIRPPGGGTLTQERPPIEELENTIIEYLRPAEKITFADMPSRPGESFNNFATFVTRMVSITIDVPYEILSNDYAGINYSTSKAVRGDTVLLLAPHKFLQEQRFSGPVFRRWLDYEALTQDYLPGYWQDPERYRAALWIPAGMPSVDPLRDGKADVESVSAGHKSPQECILSRGADPEEVVAQLAEWQRLLHDSGVSLGPRPSTALANNPAALGAEETNAPEDSPAPPSPRAEDQPARTKHKNHKNGGRKGRKRN